jgi:hypothetical protein
MVEIVARRQRRITGLLEERHALPAGVQKNLTVVLSVRGHTKDLGVKLLRALHVVDMQDDMVDSGCLDHRFLLLSLLARADKRLVPCDG